MGGPPPQHHGRGQKDNARDKGAKGEGAADEATRARFFKQLPQDDFLDKEVEMREFLLDCLDRHCAENPSSEGPSLSELGSNKECRRLKNELLKGQASLREWIDRRIGGEIATKLAKNGQVMIFYRDGRHADRAQEAPAEELPEASAGSSAKAEAFFQGLPPDGFLPEEEQLREVLLNFIESWTGADPPTLSDITQDAEVRDAKGKCIPKSSGASFKQWIDRRIGGEIATWRKDGRAKEISVGLRELWGDVANAANMEEAAANSSSKKRKADDQGGKGGAHRNLGGKGGGVPGRGR